jgi:LPXTG-motif cell wall-anchored protein
MRKVLIALAAFAAVATGAAIPAAAGGEMTYQVSIDPETGPPETVVTFTSEDGCPSQNTGDVVANAPGDSFGAISLDPEPSDASDFLADAAVDGEGQWEVQYTIPADAEPGEITFYSFCVVEDWPPDVETAAVPEDFYISAYYESSVFTVTEAPPVTSTTTTSTTQPTTTTTVAPKLVASPTTVAPGGTIAVSASGFKPGTNVVITLESDPVNLGTFVADSFGNIAANVRVPADFPAGPHTLKLTGTDIAGAVLVLSTGITVASQIQVTTTVAAAVTTFSTLPATGTSFTTPALVVGGALVLLGAVAIVAARRRRASAPR